jgi:uncharacterized cupredoxin-like copper-binding protein
MKSVRGLVLAATGLLVFAVACASSGAGGRKVQITQKDEGCTPTSIAVQPGEKLNLLLKNESSSDAYEAEGIEGTKLEEVVVHQGKTLSVGYTVPSGTGIHKVKCYVPAGPSTIIELVADDASGATIAATPAVAASPSASTTADASAGTSVAVTLVEYTVTADKPSVPAGKINFIATNVSKSQVHELAVLKVKPDGTFDNLGEVEAIDPGKGGAVELDLAPGAYELACLIAPGEAGSTADHYQQGMHTAFTVN